MQGLALLVTFAAIGKSDWSRAAMEREGGRRTNCSIRPFDGLGANGGDAAWPLQATALTLALSRAAGEGTKPSATKRMGAGLR